MSKGPRAHWAVIKLDRCTELPDADALMTAMNEGLVMQGYAEIRKLTYITDQAITLNVDLSDVCKAMDEEE